MGANGRVRARYLQHAMGLIFHLFVHTTEIYCVRSSTLKHRPPFVDRATMSADTARATQPLKRECVTCAVLDGGRTDGRTDADDAHNSFCDKVGNWESGGKEGAKRRRRTSSPAELTVAIEIEWVPSVRVIPKRAVQIVLRSQVHKAAAAEWAAATRRLPRSVLRCRAACLSAFLNENHEWTRSSRSSRLRLGWISSGGWAVVEPE